MSGKLNLVKGAFPEQMEIWLVSEYVTQLAEFEEVFHRKVRLIQNLDDFIRVVEQSPKYEGGNVYASIIFYRAMPADIVSELSNVVELLNIIQRVNIYEVEREDKFYEGSYQYGTLRQLEQDYKGLSRSEYIQDLPEDDKKKRVLEELDIELSRYKDRLEKKEEEGLMLEKEISELEREIQDLSTQLDSEKNIHGKRREEELEDLKRELSISRDSHDIDKKRVLDLRDARRKLEDEVEDLTYRQSALNNQIKRLQTEVDIRKEDYEALERDHVKLQEERADLLLQSSASQRYDSLLREFRKKEESVKKLEKDLRSVNVLLREESIRSEELEEQIEEQIRGHLAEEYHGRSSILDTMTLDNTDLVYIKVVDNLPYHRSAVKALFELLQERYNNRAKMAIIRYDDGLDKYRFEGLNVYRSLEDVEYGDEYFRLAANTSMFSGSREFEQEIDLLFVMDYTGGNEYLVDTKARNNVMTMVRRVDQIKDERYGLKGMPLTIGSESVYNLQYNSELVKSGVGRVKDRIIKVRVEDWLERLNVRG